MKRKKTPVVLLVVLLAAVLGLAVLWFATDKPPQHFPQTRVGRIFWALRLQPQPTSTPDIGVQNCIDEYQGIAEQLPIVVATQVAEGMVTNNSETSHPSSEIVWHTAPEALDLYQSSLHLRLQIMSDESELFAVTWCGQGGTDVFIISPERETWHLATAPIGWRVNFTQYDDLIVITANAGRIRRSYQIWVAEQQNLGWMTIYEAEHQILNLEGIYRLPEVIEEPEQTRLTFTLSDGTQIDRTYRLNHQGEYELLSNNDSDSAGE